MEVTNVRASTMIRVCGRAVFLATVLAGSGLAQAQGLRTPAPHRHGPAKLRHTSEDGTAYSTNWSGYAVAAPTAPATPTTPTGVTVTYVSGSWIVPALAKGSCGKGTQAEYSSFWIGIDGWYSNTVEQIGTDSDCSSGKPVYYAWYEFYPEGSFYACPAASGKNRTPPPCPLQDLTPGDVMSASVTYNTGSKNFTAVITDESIGASFTTTFTPNGKTGTPQLSSAEWIAEAPCCGKHNSMLPLANFGTVDLGEDYGNPPVIGTNSVTVNNVSSLMGAVTTPAAALWSSTMINENTPASDIPPNGTIPPTDYMAIPSSISSDFSSFSVTWKSVGP
jgi:Peptidase A4 family